MSSIERGFFGTSAIRGRVQIDLVLHRRAPREEIDVGDSSGIMDTFQLLPLTSNGEGLVGWICSVHPEERMHSTACVTVWLSQNRRSARDSRIGASIDLFVLRSFRTERGLGTWFCVVFQIVMHGTVGSVRGVTHVSSARFAER